MTLTFLFFCEMYPQLSNIRWIAMKFGIDFHGFQRMNPNNFGDNLHFPLVPP